MTLVEFVEDLEAQGVELAVNGDRLRYHGEKNILTADVLSKLKERKAEIIALQRDRVNGPRLCPVSNGQAALWFLHQLAPDSPSYNVGFPIRIRSRLDVSAMQRALCALTDRHPSLRTTFPTRNGRPVQEIHPHRPPAFEAIESGHLTQEELVSAVSRAYSRPFQIDTGPLFRAQLFTSADDDHLLLLTVHHMVCDAWSLWMLLEELGTIYRMEHGGGPATLPPLTTTYADYVRWQRELLRGPDAERLWGYWKQKLDQLPTLNLPTDRPRPAVQSFKGASRSFQIGPELAAELKKLASSEGTTLYMVLLAAFKVLLHRYSDQNDIVVGSPTSGRTKRQFANIVGDFINTVLLRSSCDGDPTFRAFLAHVSQATLDALDHEAFPFSLLVERLAPSRASDRAPLFQVLFNFLKPQSFQEAIELWVAHKAADPIEWGGLALEPFPLFQQEGQVDLALEIAEGKTSLFGLFKYSSELFDASSIARMVGHFDTLLQGIVAKPESRLSELPLLTEGERHQLLIQWNDTHADFPRNTCIHRLFEAQAARTPNAIAAVCEGEALSYGRLEAEAEAIAARLRVLGVGPGVLVGLAVERSLAMLSALIGILKAGGAYVPLDPSHPPSRLKFILKDASIGWLVSERSVVSRLQFDGQAADGSRDGLVILRLTGAETATAAKQTVTPDDLAYVIYTSGSTGQPKGVQLCHRGVVNFLMSMARELGVTSRDIFLALTTLSFDIAVLELLLPITVGGRVVISSREAAIDPERIAALIEQSAVTVIQATPATWRMLIDSGWQGSSTLKILVGGEALPPNLAGALLNRCEALWNMYGPTETTVWSSTARIASADEISIGRPIANTEFYVLHNGHQLAPIGVPGELYIGGEGLARGYWNQAELTQKAFVPHPFRPDAGARLYRTGDLVRYRPDGRVEFLGRADHQVKIRGYRIELGEIEAILRRHEAVRDAVALVREDVPGDKLLVAYVVLAPGRARSVSDLRAHVSGALPDYMVPSAFVTVDAIPVSASGKIDRRALPRPTFDCRPASDSFPRQSSTEQVMTRIWSELLRLESPGPDDSFFHVGGHSLLAVRLVTMIQQRLNVKLPVMTVITHPTIRALSSTVDADIAGHHEISLQAVARPVDVRTSMAEQSENGGRPQSRSLKARLGFEREALFRAVVNRILQLAARAAPTSLRPMLHRWRGVRIGENVLIGYDSIVETSYPWLVSIGSNSAIGMRVTIIGHFLGMEGVSVEQRQVSVDIGEDVWIGPGSLILPNVKIGKGAVVVAGSVVSGSVPPGIVVQGNPARPVARCPVPIRAGMSFETFLGQLQPLEEDHSLPRSL